MEEKLVELLKKMNYTISTAESCTGGLIASRIVNVPGCSSVFNQGFVTYANEAKVKYLNVKKSTIDEFGVVSKEVVEQMAAGCALESQSEVSAVTSGIAGPDGGTKEKPVGLVWMAIYINGQVISWKNFFSGDRNTVRNSAADEVISVLVKELEERL